MGYSRYAWCLKEGSPMHKVVVLYSLILLLAVTTPASAKLYKCADAEGNVTYTDEPCSNGEEVKLPPIITYRPSVVPLGATPTATEQKSLYTDLTIVQPANDSVVDTNEGKVTVTFNLNTGLNTQAGDRFGMILDGTKLKGTGTSTQINLTDVDPGTHKIQVVVLNSEGATLLSSNTVSFTLNRQTTFKQNERGSSPVQAPGATAAPRYGRAP